MAKVYGIDLGTTYSAIATLDDNGMPDVFENYNDGGPLLASAVYFPSGGDPVIGNQAKNQAEAEPDKVVQYVKRQIGKADAQIREFDGVKYDPIDISTLILKRMKEYVEEQGHQVNDVVITCPAYFGNEAGGGDGRIKRSEYRQRAYCRRPELLRPRISRESKNNGLRLGRWYFRHYAF